MCIRSLGDNGDIIGFHHSSVGILKVHQACLTNDGHLLGLLEYGLMVILARRLQQKIIGTADGVNVKALHLLHQCFISGGSAVDFGSWTAR